MRTFSKMNNIYLKMSYMVQKQIIWNEMNNNGMEKNNIVKK